MTDRLETLRNWFAERQEAIIADIMELAAIDSGSGDVEGIRTCQALIGQWFANFDLEVFQTETIAGPILECIHGEGPRVLLLAHCDTVFQRDSQNKPPLKIVNDTLHGPGVLDMKGSIVMILYAIRACRELELEHHLRLHCLFSPDEEVGSLASVEAIRQAAQEAAAALVPEPAQATDSQYGAIKKTRKGGGKYLVRIIGRDAHAGTNPELGLNAIHLAGDVIAAISRLNNPGRGTFCNATVISGGTAVNAIPGLVEIKVDMRFSDPSEGITTDRKLRSLDVDHPEARIQIEGGITRPPMTPSPGGTALINLYKRIASHDGITIDATSTGGGSDGNFTADEGVPTLDGIGLDGAGAHTAHEQVNLATLASRYALFTELLMNLKEHLDG